MSLNTGLLKSATLALTSLRRAAHTVAAMGPAPDSAPRGGLPAQPLWEPAFGNLHRHPEDGWTFAQPFPMPRTVRVAFRALTEGLCPPPPAPGGEALYGRIEDRVRRAMRYMHPLFAVGMMGAFYALDWSPLWTRQGVRRLRTLDRATAARVLQRAARGEIGRQLVFAARMSILSMYFDDDEVQAEIGYEPTHFMRERMALRQRLIAGGKPGRKAKIGPYSTVAAS